MLGWSITAALALFAVTVLAALVVAERKTEVVIVVLAMIFLIAVAVGVLVALLAANAVTPNP